MKIYFAASIRAGRQDASLYRDLIAFLQKQGLVLTEHVGIVSGDETDVSDRDIFVRDMKWMEEADALIGEITVPSLGVGYEIARAERRGIPILCLYRPSVKLRVSAMLTGNPACRIEPYLTIEEAKEHIADFLDYCR